MRNFFYFLLFFTVFSVSAQSSINNFSKTYYVDKFGDKTNNWYIYSEKMIGTSPNNIGGITEFRCELCIDADSVFFDLRRTNGDKYSGSGIIYVKLLSGATKAFSANNYSNGFYPVDKVAFRKILLEETSIKVVIEIPGSKYSFNLGTIYLSQLQNMLR